MKLSPWVREVVELQPGDENLPRGLDQVNLVLNRRRLAEFLEAFGGDSEVRDLLMLDLLGVALDAEISSTGEVEKLPALSFRPFRLWEYIWLYKTLNLASGGLRVLDLGGPASHLVISTLLAGNRVTSVDINPRIVEAGRHCADAMRLTDYRVEVGDMRSLDTFHPESFDRIMCCSVLEHLTGEDQRKAVGEMARVLAPGGVIGLTFDYGEPAPGANIYLPPPHEPPRNPEEVRERYIHSGLALAGNHAIEHPIPGSLFASDAVSYVMGAVLLGKPTAPQIEAPKPVCRETSLVSAIHIEDLPGSLFRTATRYRSEAADLVAQRQASLERLAALEAAHRELAMLYGEIHRRDKLDTDVPGPD